MKYAMLMPLILLAATTARADYFPVDLDAHAKHGILLPHPDGLFLYHPGTNKIRRLPLTQSGEPWFARFAPSGTEVVVVVNEAKNNFEGKLRIDLVPLQAGPTRTVF